MTAATSAAPQRTRRKSSAENRDIVPAILLGGPAFILLLTFLIGPFFAGIGFSFTNQRLISPNPTEFVGLRNYSRLLRFNTLTLQPILDEQTGQPLLDEEGNIEYPRSRDFTRDEENYPQYQGLREWFNIDIGQTRYVILAGDPIFLRSLMNNLFFAIVVIPLQTITGLALALLVNQNVPGRNFFRTIYFAPVVTSMVVVSFVWRFIYDFNNGLANELIGMFSFGLIPPINWLGDASIAMWAIIIMSVWQGAGMQMMLFLAGLQGIPEYLYEAAGIDGANSWEQFWYITLPSLRSTTVFIIITITIAAFQLIIQVWVMTNGGPDNATSTAVLHMIKEGFQEQDIAYGSTVAVIFFLIIVVIAMIQRYALRDQEG